MLESNTTERASVTPEDAYVRVRVAELEGRNLDCMVALYCGIVWDRIVDLQGIVPGLRRVLVGEQHTSETRAHEWSPSTREDQGCPLMWRARMTLKPSAAGGYLASLGYAEDGNFVMHSGRTALIAGMRCLVSSRYGEMVPVPRALADKLGFQREPS